MATWPDVKGVLKSSIFIVKKATASKSGVEFRQGSIGAIRSSVATSYDAVRRRATQSRNLLHRQAGKQAGRQETDTGTHAYGLYSEVALADNLFEILCYAYIDK